MDMTERNEKKAYISQYINVGRERYNDVEINKLLQIIDQRDAMNGVTQEYRGLPKKASSSDGRYDISEVKTFTFVSDFDGIRILYHVDVYHDGIKAYDDDQVFDTGRGLINNYNWILRKRFW